jgi:hypothetical protein
MTCHWVLILFSGVVVLALVFDGVTSWLVFRSRTVQPRVVVAVNLLEQSGDRTQDS